MPHMDTYQKKLSKKLLHNYIEIKVGRYIVKLKKENVMYLVGTGLFFYSPVTYLGSLMAPSKNFVICITYILVFNLTIFV